MRFPFARPLAALLGLAALAAVPAAAGPWTEPAGDGFLGLSNGPDPDGPTGQRRDLHYAFGWAEGLTLGANVNETRALRDARFSGRVEVFARRRLWDDGAGTVAALQTEFGAGLGGAGDAPDAALRLMLGRGHATPLGNGWSEAGMGWRAEAHGGSDRLVASLASGLRPARGWTAVAGLEADMRAERESRDWEALRLTGTGARRLSDGLQMYLRAEAPVISRGVSGGLQLRLGIWQEF
jgi:hypothetical protein